MAPIPPPGGPAHGVGKVKKISKKFDPLSVATIISISFPEEVSPTSVKYKTRFSVGIKYADKAGKKHHKTIFFGKREDAEYIDHGDLARKALTMSRLRKWGSLFDKNFYRAHLLNGPTTNIVTNYSKLIAMLKVTDSSG